MATGYATDYFVSADKALLQPERIHRFLSTQAYWCEEISRAVVDRAIENSVCFGVYQDAATPIQIGFARVVTDEATFAYLCDVYIEPEHRGRGLSKKLMEFIMNYPALQGLRRFCLGTRDAHGLYEGFGFRVIQTPANWMEIKDNELYKKLRTR